MADEHHAAPPVFMIVDGLAFRRACIAHLLQPRMEELHFRVAVASGGSFGLQPSDVGVALVVLGHEPSAMDDLKATVAAIHAEAPGMRLAVLATVEHDGDVVRGAFHAGASAFLTADMDPSLVLRALDFVAAGGTFCSPAALALLERHHGVPVDEDHSADRVTQRQQEVMSYLREGLSNKLIARKMRISEATVKIHVRHIMRRMGVRNRTQVALLAANAANAAGTPADSRARMPIAPLRRGAPPTHLDVA
jgi:two-component system nitrate/nitrite response regulator NarL